MRAVLQRVTRASVKVEGEVVGEIGCGLLVLLGLAKDDTERDAVYLLEKILGLRIFDDEAGHMNLSVVEKDCALLIVSQFTLYGDARRGRRPSWSDAAAPEAALPLYQLFVELAERSAMQVQTGSFGKMMQVELINDGPVTIMLDSRKLF
jgi:D-aminoacyl-tRNA deacylase